jgi:hypothetical protein
MKDQNIEELNLIISASLRRTGENFFLVWPVVIAIVWAAEYYETRWFLIIATLNLVVVLFFVSIPNAVRITALKKINYDFTGRLKKQLVLAYIGVLLILVDVAFLWITTQFFYIGTTTTSICFVIAFVNSLSN